MTEHIDRASRILATGREDLTGDLDVVQAIDTSGGAAEATAASTDEAGQHAPRRSAAGAAGIIHAVYTGSERVELSGAVHTGPNAEGDLARALIGQGIDPGEMLVFSRNGTPALRGTVGAFAGRAWAGADADPQFRRWRPHPQGSYAPLLMEWHAQRPVPRARGRVGWVRVGEGSGGAASEEKCPPGRPA
jgi:hypothetical protein